MFRTNSPAATVLRWRVLRKRGEPLLVVPPSGKAAAASLALYPAQTAKARLLRKFLRAALKLNLPLPLERADVAVDVASPFARFLTEQAGTKAFPQLGIFVGNPRTTGRRFILLLFGEHNAPVCVVKAGLGEAAMQLIQREQTFLASVPVSVAGVPKLFGTFRGENLSAFAMEFSDGQSPPVADETVVPTLVNAWAGGQRTVRLTETAPWKALEAHCFFSTCLERPGPTLAARDAMCARLEKWPPVRGVLWHGDLAPWNLKMNRATGRVVVLDWERGELSGVPGWDWFHFLIQTAVLVKKLSVPALRDDLERLLRSEKFLAYAQHCGIAGCERELALAYLHYNIFVLRPSEGWEPIQALLELFANSWTSDSKS